MKKVLWLIEGVKSGLQSFVLEISHWMTFHSQVDQWSWQQSNKDNNGEQWMLHQQEIADILKTSKSSPENHLQQLGYVEVKWKSFSRVRLFTTPGTVACQAPQSMGILQARILEWVAIPFSRGSSELRDQTQVSHNVNGFFTIWATREVHIGSVNHFNVWVAHKLSKKKLLECISACNSLLKNNEN